MADVATEEKGQFGSPMAMAVVSAPAAAGCRAQAAEEGSGGGLVAGHVVKRRIQGLARQAPRAGPAL